MRMVKTWKVTVSYRFSAPGESETYYVKGETLYDAFYNYYKLWGTKHLVAIQITEVKQDE